MSYRLFRFAAYAATGVVVAVVVYGFEYITVDIMLEELWKRPRWQQAISPGLGLIVAALLLRFVGRGAPTSTSEDYIRAYHDRQQRLRVLHLPARLLAGIATIGTGGTLGLEGPSIYTGATLGSSIQHRLRALFSDKDAKLLLVAGAAAGVSAIFKAPATGVLFALEAPYKGDVARRALLPALIASATSYLTFVTFTSTSPIFDLRTRTLPTFDRATLAGAAVIGVLAGLGAVLFSLVLNGAKRIQRDVGVWRRVIGAAVALGLLVLLSDELFDAPLSLGPAAGGELLVWVSDPEHSLALIVALFVIRIAATAITTAGGGVGGVFIPLAVLGLVLGQFIGSLSVFDDADTQLFPLIGLAAFLGAGYRTPLAAVVFITESTVQAGFVVPALIAVAVSQVLIGSSSVSSFQLDTRSGHLERRFRMPLSTALVTDVATIRPDVSIGEFVFGHAMRRRELASIVVDDDERYVGVCLVRDATQIERDEWYERQASEIMLTELVPGRLSWTLREAIGAMEAYDLDVLPVVDVTGRFLGVVTTDDILKLDEILEETEGGAN